MKNWWDTFAENLWLKPDNVGAEEAAFIKKALQLRRGKSVLDAPCGAGRIAIHLARAGCVVTGIDLSPSFINRAKAHFRMEKQKDSFIVMDLKEMPFLDKFDGIYSWLGSFGYFSDRENLDIIKRYALALHPGGRLLVDQPNREALLRHFEQSRQWENITIRNSWNPKTQRIESDWIVEKNHQIQHNRMSIRLYTPVQLQGLFQQAGLTVERMYGAITGEPYGRSSKRLIVVGKKR